MIVISFYSSRSNTGQEQTKLIISLTGFFGNSSPSQESRNYPSNVVRWGDDRDGNVDEFAVISFLSNRSTEFCLQIIENWWESK